MEGHIALWMGVAALGSFLIGVLVGIGVRRPGQETARRVQELESELHQSKEELARYRNQVTQHFVQTADLLQAMTANYRAVYEHLANGAQHLCTEPVQALSPAALRERLLPEDAVAAAPAEQPSPSNTVRNEAEMGQDSPQSQTNS